MRVKFGDLAQCVNDRVDDPKAAGVERYVGLEHLDPGNLSICRWGTPDEVESTKLRFKPGDIIFGKRRAYQRKLAVADFEGICSAHAMVLRAKPKAVLPEFLPFFMQSDLFMERAVAISVGSLSPTINWKTLAAEEFALPPLDEQRRLATVLRRAADVAGEFRSAARIGNRARDSLIVELYTRGLRGESMTTTPVGSVPRSWSVEPLGNRYSIQLGKMMSETARSGGNGGKHIPYLRNANVQWNRLELDDVATMAFTETEREKFCLRPGDILACEGRHVGKSAIWRDEIPGACYQKALHRLRATGSDVPEFLLHCLYFLSITGRFVALTGETTIPHLPAEKLRSMEIAFPSVGEQKEISQAIDSFDRSIDALNMRAQRAAALIRSFNVEAA
ncbi:MAG: restriction endonuclease subunit S [Myxococcales bacterium]|nr:restriction endonuclease subunit S [Myxococcales bacterium]